VSVDPNVLAVGFDVTQLAPGELGRRGVALVPGVVVVDGAAEAWATHSQYASMNPEADAVERGYARQASHLHVDRLCRDAVACPQCGAARGQRCRGGTAASRLEHVHDQRRRAGRDAGAATLRGLELKRSFPCLGTLRTLEWHGPLRVVQCDRCGLDLGVRGRVPEPDEPDDAAPAEPEQDAFGGVP
jgi:hypothetical protein